MKSRISEKKGKFILNLILVGFFLSFLQVTAQIQEYKWEEESPLNKPSPRHGHAMVYDSQRGVVILFGGFGQVNSDPKNDTWK